MIVRRRGELRCRGAVALRSPAPDTEKGEKFFGRALAVARRQQAKSLRNGHEESEQNCELCKNALWRQHWRFRSVGRLLTPYYYEGWPHDPSGWWCPIFDFRQPMTFDDGFAT